MAHDEVDSPWPREAIPDEAKLYMRVPRAHIDPLTAQPIPGAFHDIEGGMSVDWERYSTAVDTLRRARRTDWQGAVLSLVAGNVRSHPTLKVEHTPMRENQAHSDVLGKKDPEARLHLRRIYCWEIPYFIVPVS